MFKLVQNFCSNWAGLLRKKNQNLLEKYYVKLSHFLYIFLPMEVSCQVINQELSIVCNIWEGGDEPPFFRHDLQLRLFKVSLQISEKGSATWEIISFSANGLLKFQSNPDLGIKQHLDINVLNKIFKRIQFSQKQIHNCRISSKNTSIAFYKSRSI